MAVWRERILSASYWVLLAWCLFVLAFQRDLANGGEALLCLLGVLDAANGVFRRFRPQTVLGAWGLIWAMSLVPTLVAVFAWISPRGDKILATLALLWVVSLLVGGLFQSKGQRATDFQSTE